MKVQYVKFGDRYAIKVKGWFFWSWIVEGLSVETTWTVLCLFHNPMTFPALTLFGSHKKCDSVLTMYLTKGVVDKSFTVMETK